MQYPMRLTLVNAVREFGGGERWLVNFAAAMRSAGHGVSALCRPSAVWQEVASGAGVTLINRGAERGECVGIFRG